MHPTAQAVTAVGMEGQVVSPVEAPAFDGLKTIADVRCGPKCRGYFDPRSGLAGDDAHIQASKAWNDLKDVTIDRFAPEPERGAELAELLEAVRHLPPRQREMIGLAAAGHTVNEIAELHGCSAARASQLLLQARFRLDERTAA